MTRKGATVDVGAWLQGLGLGHYEAAFRENEIDDTVLPNLTAEDLKDLASPPSSTAATCSMLSRTRALARKHLRLRRWQLLSHVRSVLQHCRYTLLAKCANFWRD